MGYDKREDENIINEKCWNCGQIVYFPREMIGEYIHCNFCDVVL